MAPSRRSAPAKGSRTTPKSNKRASESSQDAPKSTFEDAQDKPFLLLDDVTCKICLNIMIKPVSLPCKHDLCFACYESCVEKANLSCPMCRKRISVWCRQATKSKSIVNQVLWGKIQDQFPDLVKSQTEGGDEEKDPDEYFPTVPMHQFAEPGEVLKEFEAEQERLRQEEEKRKKEEEIASASLIAEYEREQAEIRALLEERERIRLEDEALALELSVREDTSRNLRTSTVMQTPPSTRKRPRKASTESAKSTPAAKKINKFFPSHSVSREDSQTSAFVAVTEHLPKCDVSVTPRSSSSTSSTSIDKEVAKKLHFRPINAAPLTPPKTSPGQIVKPQVVPGTAKNLSQFYEQDDDKIDDGDENHNQDSDAEKVSATLAEELQEMERQWLRRKEEQEEADRKMARELQEQMDKETRSLAVVNRSKGSKDEYQLRANKLKNQPNIEDSFQRPIRKSTEPLP